MGRKHKSDSVFCCYTLKGIAPSFALATTISLALVFNGFSGNIGFVFAIIFLLAAHIAPFILDSGKEK